jgi:polyisoprenoid-binding protein YceI
MKRFMFFPVLLVMLSFSSHAQTSWTFDKAVTDIGFSVTHLVISEVEGHFAAYEGTVTTKGDDFSNAQVNFTVDIASIDTGNEKRDAHLKADDFFNAEKFPKMTFKGRAMTKTGKDTYKLVGDLTIRDKTRKVELDVKHNGTVKDPWGNTKAGFKISGVLDRFDFDLKWNTLTEMGGAVVGKEVRLDLNVQLQKKV